MRQNCGRRDIIRKDKETVRLWDRAVRKGAHRSINALMCGPSLRFAALRRSVFIRKTTLLVNWKARIVLPTFRGLTARPDDGPDRFRPLPFRPSSPSLTNGRFRDAGDVGGIVGDFRSGRCRKN
jgi:hypothetical protein